MTAARPYAVAARELLHATIFDAVSAQLRDRSWSEVSMASVAAAAGVSRQTLYNAFGSRQDLARAYVMREVDAFLADVEAAVASGGEDIAVAVAAAYELFLAAAAEHPLVRTIVTGDGDDELLPLVTTHGQPVLLRATERLESVLLETWPALDPAEAGVMAEAVVRLAISHVVLPAPSTRLDGAAVARLLAR